MKEEVVQRRLMLSGLTPSVNNLGHKVGSGQELLKDCKELKEL